MTVDIQNFVFSMLVQSLNGFYMFKMTDNAIVQNLGVVHLGEENE